MAFQGKNTILIKLQIFFQRIQMAEDDIRYLGRLFWFFLIPDDWSQEKRLRLVSNIPVLQYILLQWQQYVGGEEEKKCGVVVPINNQAHVIVYTQFKIIHGKYDSWRI